MRALLAILLFFSFSQFSLAGKGHKAHVHGEGKLTLAVDGKMLEIEMEIPADDIVGFEHKPKNKKQKAAVKTAAKKLRNSMEMVGLPAKAECRSKKVEVESALLGGHGHHHHGHDHDDEGHSEFEITYKFKCKSPEALQSVQINLFKSFPSLKELKGQAVTAKGQFSQELTSSKNTFLLKK